MIPCFSFIYKHPININILVNSTQPVLRMAVPAKILSFIAARKSTWGGNFSTSDSNSGDDRYKCADLRDLFVLPSLLQKCLYDFSQFQVVCVAELGVVTDPSAWLAGCSEIAVDVLYCVSQYR